MKTAPLVDVPMIAYADIEDGCLLLVTSVLTKDTDPELESVMEGTLARAPIEDYTYETPDYLFGKARVRKWQL